MKDCHITKVDIGLRLESVSGDDDQPGLADEADEDVNDVGVKCGWRGHQDLVIWSQLEMEHHVNNVGNNTRVCNIDGLSFS